MVSVVNLKPFSHSLFHTTYMLTILTSSLFVTFDSAKKKHKEKKTKNNKRKGEKEFFQSKIHIHTENNQIEKKTKRKRKKIANVDAVCQLFPFFFSDIKMSAIVML